MPFPAISWKVQKGLKYWLSLKNKDKTKNVMDKIWDRNLSKLEVIGRYGGDEKTNDHAELTKVNR